MIIKVCGMRDAENIRAVSALDIDWIGFIFWSESPRYVRQIPSHSGIIPDRSSLRNMDMKRSGNVDEKPLVRVGVFVDEMPQTIVTRVYNYHLDIVQLHGSESSVMIDNLRATLDPDIRPGVKIMKALSISSAYDLRRCDEYHGHADYFLFDTKTSLVGGSGKHFDWSVLDAYDGDTPFILSGGIGPEDASRIRTLRHPRLAGIDVNSRFELTPAFKDVEKLRQFVNSVRT